MKHLTLSLAVFSLCFALVGNAKIRKEPVHKHPSKSVRSAIHKPPCDPCDHTHTIPIVPPTMCLCDAQTCATEPTEACEHSQIVKINFGSNMCPIDSIVVRGQGVCWKGCIASGPVPLQFWAGDKSRCDNFDGKFLAIPGAGAGSVVFVQICESSLGNNWQIDIYSNGTGVPCGFSVTL